MSLSRPVEELIGRYIDSIETLEILLLLQRSPDTYWRPEAIDSHLGLKKGIADAKLQPLLRNELVTAGISGGYRYHVADEELRAHVAELACDYASRRVAVVNSVYSESLARLRAFSDAFRVKGK